MRTNSNSLTRWPHFSIERLLLSVLTSITIHHKFAELAPVTAILISLSPSLICYLSEVHDLICASTKKTFSLDPIPTKLVFDCLGILLPVITKIIYYSLEHGVFPSVCKNALVFPSLISEMASNQYSRIIDL